MTTTFSAAPACTITVIGPDGAQEHRWGVTHAAGAATRYVVWTASTGPHKPPDAGVREPRRPLPPTPLAGAVASC